MIMPLSESCDMTSKNIVAHISDGDLWVHNNNNNVFFHVPFIHFEHIAHYKRLECSYITIVFAIILILPMLRLSQIHSSVERSGQKLAGQ